MRFFLALTLMLAFNACNNSNINIIKPIPEAAKTDSIPSKTEYYCPMHPSIISDKPAQCSECGMDLEKK